MGVRLVGGFLFLGLRADFQNTCSLAWAELYLTIGALFSRFELELAGTGREDVDICRENFTPQARKGSKGVRVWVR